MPTRKKSQLPPRVPTGGVLQALSSFPTSESQEKQPHRRRSSSWRIQHVDFASKPVFAALKKGGWNGLVPQTQPATEDDAFDPAYMLAALREMLSRPAIPSYSSPIGFPDDCHQDRLIFNEIGAEQCIQNEIWPAVQFYLFEKENQQSPDEFRAELAQFDEALKLFLSKIPTLDSSIFVALKAAWTARDRQDLGCPLCDDNVDPELYFDARFGRLQADLALMLDIVHQVRVDESGKGRDANRPAHNLVRSLGCVFEHLTGNKPARGYDKTGAFFEFIAAINKQIPGGFKLKDIDHLIRSYLGQ
jgi:hypothetical protein